MTSLVLAPLGVIVFGTLYWLAARRTGSNRPAGCCGGGCGSCEPKPGTQPQPDRSESYESR